MSGGPSQIDLFDYKPKLADHHGQELPDSVRQGPAHHRHDVRAEVVSVRRADVQVRAARPVRHLGQRAVAAHGRRSSMTSRVINSLNTEAINHDPAITFIQTGAQQPGRPSLGSWLSYGLGSENREPARPSW